MRTKKNIEVFKTNLQEAAEADKILKLLHRQFPHYHANIDLSDCDKILRIECRSGTVDEIVIKKLISEAGYISEVLQG